MFSTTPFFLLFFITIICLLPPPSSPSNHHLHHLDRHAKAPNIAQPRTTPHVPHQFPQKVNIPKSTFDNKNPTKGQWSQLQESIGISAMHMQLLHNNKVVIFDRTDFGPSNISLPLGKCRFNDEVLPQDCTAHSIVYDINTNIFRPLMVQTDVWCSSAAVSRDGVLIQTGGYHAGDKKIRTFAPCIDDGCDWTELKQNLGVTRWYASNQILPDGRVIIVGGRGQFSYEFFPKNGDDSEVFLMNFLKETTDFEEENNLYPFLHLLPDGNLFVFANQRSVLFDYINNIVLREFPMIPGEKRNYPATGSSVMLPLKLAGVGGRPVVEVVVCGGAKGGAFMAASLNGVYMAGSNSCGRLRVTEQFPIWVMEKMPMARVMPDMLLLPTGDVIIINGAGRGTGGWDSAVDPVLHPVLYKPGETDPNKRFTILNSTTRPRMYHSSAILLPDGRILVGGHNPHKTYNFTGVRYPTDLSLEVFMPPYMDYGYDHLRPSINSIEGSGSSNIVSYGQLFSIIFELPSSQTTDMGRLMVSMVAPSFTTHSFAMNQRLLELEIVEVQLLGEAWNVRVSTPPTINIAPPGYYMLFVVHEGIPGQAVWIKMVNP